MSDIEVFRRLEDVEPHWRTLEAEASASPFQRFAWMASYIRTVSAGNGAEPAIVVIRGASGRAVGIMPLEKVKKSAATILRSIGGKHASFHLPLATAEGKDLIAKHPPALLRRAAQAAGGADLVLLSSQPGEWEGAPDPFATLGGVEAASRAYETVLPIDADTFIRNKTSGDARKKLRKKRQALEKIGTVMATRPTGPGAVAETLDAFLAQKQRRFAAQGIANPFAEAATEAFLRAASAPGGAEPPAIELHALTCAGKIVAVFGLATGFSRASGMFTSFDDDPAIARCSPGDILLHEMIRDLVARRFSHFDLGVGEARYKNAFCDHEIILTDTLMPLTPYGRLAATALRAASRVKAIVKSDPRLLKAANRLRSTLRPRG